jgi:hypothetical protein
MAETQASESANGAQLFLISKPAVVGEDYSFVLTPNQTETLTVHVTNPTKTDFQVTSHLDDLATNENNAGLSNWTSLSEVTYILRAGETKELFLTIATPKTAAAGGYYAFLTHSFEPEASGSGEIDQTGTAIYALIGGETSEELIVENFKVDKFWEREPVEYQLTLQNLTSYHLLPDAKVTVVNKKGEIVDEVQVRMENELLPAAVQTYRGELLTAKQWGKFKAKLEVAYGQNGDHVMTAESEFWVVPLRLILLALLCLIIGITFLCKKILGKR